MLDRATIIEDSAAAMPASRASTKSPATFQLDGEHYDEVLGFLAERPLYTVMMTGLIRDHGLVSPLNRGSFFGCRDSQGRLKGVALIGHATLIEARTDAALAAFARVA